jgi:hypothetical protein
MLFKLAGKEYHVVARDAEVIQNPNDLVEIGSTQFGVLLQVESNTITH